ncbi:MAG: aminotransferase class V-fold PLP-dependent enzyme, partial [Actinomycetes bacterium]
VGRGRRLRRGNEAAAPPGQGAGGSPRPSSPDADLGDFGLDPGVVNLTTFLLSSHPRLVREAIERQRRALDANPAGYLHESEAGLEAAAQAAAAAYLRTEPDLVALTDSTTMGLGLVYGRLRLQRGDEVVTTEHDFYATHEALRLRRTLEGVTVRRIRLYDVPETASAGSIVAAIARSLGPRTRCLAITWVHSSTGVRLPLREIADVVARANRGRPAHHRILLCVDGVHGFGALETSPVELGVDVFISGCHKWLFGPRGTGVVWATGPAWDRLAPTIPTFDGRAYGAWLRGRAPTDTPPGPLMTPGGFHSFEHRWALTEAFAFHDRLGGRAVVADRTRRLAARLKEALARIDRVTVRTPVEETLSAGLVCAEVARFSAADVVERLRIDHGVVASVTPYLTQYVRFGPSIANSTEDVDRAVEAIAAVAGR